MSSLYDIKLRSADRKLGLFFSTLLLATAAAASVHAGQPAQKSKPTPLPASFVAKPIAAPIVDAARAVATGPVIAYRSIAGRNGTAVALSQEQTMQMVATKLKPSEMIADLFRSIRPVPAPDAMVSEQPMVNVAMARN